MKFTGSIKVMEAVEPVVGLSSWFSSGKTPVLASSIFRYLFVLVRRPYAVKRKASVSRTTSRKLTPLIAGLHGAVVRQHSYSDFVNCAVTKIAPDALSSPSEHLQRCGILRH